MHRYAAIFFRWEVFELGGILGAHPCTAMSSVISLTQMFFFCLIMMASVITALCLSCESLLSGLFSNPGDLGSSDAEFVFKARQMGMMFGTSLSAL